jgi:tetratricopeptide (TPR) repeat protein
VKSFNAFDSDVEHFNTTAHPSQPIYVRTHDKALTQEETQAFFTLIDNLSERIAGIKDFTKDRALLIERAVAYTVVQNFDEAINDLSAYIQTDSTSSVAYWQRAVCQALMNEFTQSQGMEANLKTARTLSDFEEAIRRNPQNAFLYYDRGNVYASLQDYQHAIDDYSRAITLEPNLAEAYYNRGLILIRTGKRKEGIDDLSKAGERGLYDAYSVIKQYRDKE